ncbi:MAG: hypothetical protein ABI548_13895 [Polyangiaceae bacterium]
MQFVPAALGLALLPSISGCFAAVGPTIGLDLPTGRATLGVEASAETFTVAHSVALGGQHSEPAERVPVNAREQTNARTASSTASTKDWSTHTYLLWEPGLGAALGDNTASKFVWLGGGASVGVRLNRYADAPMDANLVAGAWASGGHALTNQESHECGASDTRPFVALVVGIRGSELYASPKLGVMHVPGLCIRLFDDGASF